MSKKQIRSAFRTVCFERDKHKCVMCGLTKDLAAHHITDRHDMANGGYVAENGITLCPECHIKAEVFHVTGESLDGFSPEDLYNKIGSSKEVAIVADSKNK